MSNPTDQIKEKLDIVELINSYIKLEKSGINYKARCPFHNEKTASFFVSPSRQNFYCFGCGANGDIFSFVEKFEGLDFVSSLKILAEKAGVEIKNYKKEPGNKDKDTVYEVLEEAAGFYKDNLVKNEAVLAYLKNRGLSTKSIEKWRIGYALDDWRTLHDYLHSRGYDLKILSQAGLIKESNGKKYDTFRGRIVFPIFDNSGRVVAFSGRIFKDDGKSPKYLNSPETEVFKKTSTLYGWNFAKDAIRKLDYAVLVEGQFDLVLSHQALVTNTVATSGTALTLDHVKIIKRLTDRVIIAYDSDEAGEKAALRATQLFLSMGMEVKIAKMKTNEDPASIIEKGEEDWKEVLRKSQHFIDFVIERSLENNKGVKLIKTVEKEVLPYLLWLNSEIERSHFIKKIADKIGVKEEAISKDLSRITPSKQDTGGELASDYDYGILPERLLIGFIFNEDEKGTYRKKLEEIIGTEEVKNLYLRYEKEKEKIIFEAENYASTIPKSKIFEDLLKKIELNNLKERLLIITNTLDRSTGENKSEAEKEIAVISKRISELSKN